LSIEGELKMNMGKARRLARLFQADGKCLVVAMDHAGFMDKPLAGLEHPAQTVHAVARGGADAFLMTLGSAQLATTDLGNAGLWLSVDATPPLLDRIVETAMQIGADGIKCMVYPGWDEQPNSMANLSALATDCARWGLPLMAEVIPGGFLAGAEMRTPEKIAAGARNAMEAGADVIKTFYTGDAESFQRVVEYCAVPVMVLGGERVKNDDDLFASVRGALDAGASGVVIGRNIWQHPTPEQLTAKLARIVHPPK
jgi:DhnA family fructose-bisphosphate aldolase class Ia